MKKRLLTTILLITTIILTPLFAEEGSLADDLATIMQKELSLEKKIKEIIESPGVKVNGILKFSSVDTLFMGPGAAYAVGKTSTAGSERYRPMVQYLDLDFSANVVKGIELHGIFRFENVLGGSWGYYNIYGMRRLYVKGQTPWLDFYVGDYQAKLTSLTLMPVDDVYGLEKFQSDIFEYREKSNKSDLYLIDNTWPLSGVSMEKEFDIVKDIFGIGYKLYGAYLGRAGAFNVKLYDSNYETFMPYIYPHNQFLYSISPDIKLLNVITLTGNYLKIFDAADSGDLTAPAVDNTIIGGTAKIELLDGLLTLYGEYNMSSYDWGYNVSGHEPVTGTAMKGEAQIKVTYLLPFTPEIKIKGGFLKVDDTYTNFASQTRVYDAAQNYQYFLTQNNTWNVDAKGDQPQSYDFVGGVYPLTKYNNIIIVGQYLSYYQINELALPYGESTPDRQTMYFDINISVDGGHELYGFYKFITELEKDLGVVPLRDFMVSGGGIKLNIFDLAELKGGIKIESVENGGNLYPASMNIMSADAGIKIPVGVVDLIGGLKLSTFNGKELNGINKINYDGNTVSYGGGIKYNISETSYFNILYTDSVLTDNITDTNNFKIQEIDANVTFKF